jgi:hypothetical protein
MVASCLGVALPGGRNQEVLPASLKLPKIQAIAAYLIRGRPVCQAAGWLKGWSCGDPGKMVIDQLCSENLAAGFSQRRPGWKAWEPKS